jgi:hypothetical protein
MIGECEGCTEFRECRVVQYSSGAGMNVWWVCEECIDKLNEMVLGFMGELPPGDGE